MANELIVKDEILIGTTSDKVWEVLVTPKFVAEWDELPEDYPEEKMVVGSKVVWNHPNGGQVVTTIIKADVEKELEIALHSSTWNVPVNVGDIVYRYRLENRNGQTLLSIEIGDFSLLPNGQDYYDASVNFAKEAKEKIKQLAESL